MSIQRFLLIILACISMQTTAKAGIIHSMEHGGMAYFFMDFPARVECYDLSNRTWTAAIDLPDTRGNLSAGWIDDDGIYIAYGQAVYRYDLYGSNEVHLVNTAENVFQIFSDNDVLLLNRTSGSYARLTSIDKNNNTLIANFTNYIDSLYGASIAPTINKIFGRTSGISPSDIAYASYNSDGTFGSGGDSPHHGDYPGANKTWVFPDDGKVVDNSGTIYSTSSLSYLKSFGTSITDLKFYGDEIPILLNGSTLTAYAISILPTGSVTLDHTPDKIYISDDDVITFTLDNSTPNGILERIQSLSTLNPPTPGAAIDPIGLPYTPDISFVDKDGILNLFSKSNQSIFRWDTVTQQYTNAIPLVGVPEYAAYSADNHTIYTAYESGLIREISLDDTNYTETAFASLPSKPLGLSTAGAYVFACDGSGAWVSHYTFDQNGLQVEAVDWNYRSTEYVWNNTNQKMYFFRDGTSPNDLLWEEINADGITYSGEPSGGIGTKKDSPLHSSSGFTHPIRVAPNGSVVVLGSGVIHEGTSLARLTTSLANSVKDIGWLGSDIYTLRTISGVTQYQQWLQPTYGVGNVKQYPGTANRLISINSTNLLGISISSAGIPSFYILDSSFDVIAPDLMKGPTAVLAEIVNATQVDLGWFDVSGESSYRIERKTEGSTSWVEIGTTGTSETSFSDYSVTIGSTYGYRIVAVNGTKESTPSSIASVALKVPDATTGMTAQTVSSRKIAISWNDVGYETEYSLERKTGATGSWSVITTLPKDCVVYTNANLTPNTEYSYRITAVNGLGASPASSTAIAITDQEAPTQPSLYSPIVTTSSVSLQWSDSNYEERYYIERLNPEASSWTTLATNAADIISYTDLSVQPTNTYSYRIVAYNTVGYSDYSETRTISTPQLPPPSAPTGLSARPVSSSEIAVHWEDVLGETGYILERRTEDPLSWAAIHTNSTSEPGTIEFIDNTVTASTEYWYRVKAYNAIGLSPYSNEDNAIPMDITYILSDDFDPSIDPVMWAATSGGIATNFGSGFLSGNGLLFSSATIRSTESIPLDLRLGGTLSFKIRAGNQNVDDWNNSESGETVVLEYSIDGTTWTTIQTLNTVYPSLSDWASFSIAIPSEAMTGSTRLRWRQNQHSGSDYDVWALDDIVVEGAVPLPPSAPPFLLSSPNSATSVSLFWAESIGATSYTVERSSLGQPWSVLASLPATQSYYTDMTCAPGTFYSYRVVALNAGGHSPYSTASYVSTYTQLENWLVKNYETKEPAGEAALLAEDKNGINNLTKFAYNMNATDSMYHTPETGTSGLPAIWLERGQFCVEFVRRKSASNPGIKYDVQVSETIGDWVTIGSLESITPIDNIWERVRVEDSNCPTNCNTRFIRVIITKE